MIIIINTVFSHGTVVLLVYSAVFKSLSRLLVQPEQGLLTVALWAICTVHMELCFCLQRFRISAMCFYCIYFQNYKSSFATRFPFPEAMNNMLLSENMLLF